MRAVSSSVQESGLEREASRHAWASNQPADTILRIIPQRWQDWLVEHPIRAFYGPLVLLGTVFGGLTAAFTKVNIWTTAGAMLLWTFLVLYLRAGLLLMSARAAHDVLSEREHRVHGQAARELRRQKRLLESLMDHHHVRFRESITLRYVVGANAAQDRAERIHITRADESRFLHWRHFYISGTGSGTALLYSVEDANATARDLSTGGPIDLYEIKATGTQLRVVAVFAKPIDATPRKWSFAWQWPGQWNDLRQDHEDEVMVDVTEDSWDDVRVEIVLPPGAVAAAFRQLSHKGESKVVNRRGETSLQWGIRGPTPGRYVLRFGVERFLTA